MISSERNSEVFRIVFTIVQILFKDKQASYFQHRVNPVMSRVWAFSTRLAEPCRSFLHSTQTYGSQSYSLKAWIQYPVLSSCEHLGQYHRMNKQLLRIVLAIWKHLICQRFIFECDWAYCIVLGSHWGDEWRGLEMKTSHLLQN